MHLMKWKQNEPIWTKHNFNNFRRFPTAPKVAFKDTDRIYLFMTFVIFLIIFRSLLRYFDKGVGSTELVMQKTDRKTAEWMSIPNSTLPRGFIKLKIMINYDHFINKKHIHFLCMYKDKNGKCPPYCKIYPKHIYYFRANIHPHTESNYIPI